MRSLAVLIVVAALCSSAQARAGVLGVPALALDADLVGADVIPNTVPDLATSAAATHAAPVEHARRTYQVPNRYSFAFDETRAFWFAAGASAAISLGAHVLVGLPTTLVAAVVVLSIASGNPVVAVPLFALAAGAYFAVHAIGTGIVSTLVFNGMSDIYEGHALANIAGHLAGDALGVGVTTLMFGAGGMLMGGLSGLAAFTGSAGWETVLVLSLLGSLPAVVIAGVALVCAPALIGVWALAVTADVADGYAQAPDWKTRIGDGAGDGGGKPSIGLRPASSARDAPALPLARITFDSPTAR